MRLGGNDYTVRELGGAFGDLGTLIPVVAGYVTITGMDPAGLLLGFGVFGVVTGLHFKTPIAVQQSRPSPDDAHPPMTPIRRSRA